MDNNYNGFNNEDSNNGYSGYNPDYSNNNRQQNSYDNGMQTDIIIITTTAEITVRAAITVSAEEKFHAILSAKDSSAVCASSHSSYFFS